MDGDTTPRCPFRDRAGTWVLGTHADVREAANDPGTFSSAVSRHLQIPNALDGVEHTRWRALVDEWFTPARVSALEPRLRAAARDLVAPYADGRDFDAVGDLGGAYAVRATCSWLGWPRGAEEWLRGWMADNHAATRSGEYARTEAVAEQFDEFIRRLTAARREAGPDAVSDVTGELVRARFGGRLLTDAEIVSILRNWTAGDLATIALCVGVVLRTLAERPDVEADVRARARAGDARALERAVDELLRLDDPFVSNRRVTTRGTTLSGVHLGEGERVALDWTRANLDPEVFADGWSPEAHARDNLVYGTGPHVCPGRGLATLELRVLLEEVLAVSSRIEVAGPGEREVPPLGGWAVAPVRLR